MENKKMDVFDRAWLYLAKTVYANHGLVADFRIVPVDRDEGQERGREYGQHPKKP